MVPITSPLREAYCSSPVVATDRAAKPMEAKVYSIRIQNLSGITLP